MGASGKSRNRDAQVSRLVSILQRIGVLDEHSRRTTRATQLAKWARDLLRWKHQDGFEGQEFVHQLGVELYENERLLAECPSSDPAQWAWLKKLISTFVQRASRAGRDGRKDFEVSEHIEDLIADSVTPEQIVAVLQTADQLDSLLERHREFVPLIEHAELRKDLAAFAQKLGMTKEELKRLLARFKDHFDRHVRDADARIDSGSKKNDSDPEDPR